MATRSESSGFVGVIVGLVLVLGIGVGIFYATGNLGTETTLKIGTTGSK